MALLMFSVFSHHPLESSSLITTHNANRTRLQLQTPSSFLPLFPFFVLFSVLFCFVFLAICHSGPQITGSFCWKSAGMFGVWRLYKTWISVTVQIEEFWMPRAEYSCLWAPREMIPKTKEKCMGRSTSSNRTNLPFVTLLSPPETRSYFPRTTWKQWLHLDSALSHCSPRWRTVFAG